MDQPLRLLNLGFSNDSESILVKFPRFTLRTSKLLVCLLHNTFANIKNFFLPDPVTSYNFCNKNPLVFIDMSTIFSIYDCALTAARQGQSVRFEGLSPSHLCNRRGLRPPRIAPFLTVRHGNVSKYLSQIKQLLAMGDEVLTKQQEFASAARQLELDPGLYDLTKPSESAALLKLLSSTVTCIEDYLNARNWVKQPPVDSDESKEYSRIIRVLETTGGILSKPSLLHNLEICLCSSNNEGIYLNLRNVFSRDNSDPSLLETVRWDKTYNTLMVYFKDLPRPWIFSLNGLDIFPKNLMDPANKEPSSPADSGIGDSPGPADSPESPTPPVDTVN